MENYFLKKVRAGEKCLGTFSFLTIGNAVEALSYTGLDFIIIDAEHGTVETETTEIVISEAAKEDLMIAGRTRATVTVMVPETTTVLHARARDVRDETIVTVTVR